MQHPNRRLRGRSPATTTTLPDVAKLPNNPYGEGTWLNPDQLLATQSAFAACM
jgi:hypothetical protein